MVLVTSISSRPGGELLTRPPLSPEPAARPPPKSDSGPSQLPQHPARTMIVPSGRRLLTMDRNQGAVVSDPLRLELIRQVLRDPGSPVIQLLVDHQPDFRSGHSHIASLR
uniref:Uncharacterized protein n=1 Tax=Rhodococcus sp. Mel TaxID=1093626 RepID=H8ZKU4_9NOCA|nr:hypothetical protein [Rhodococcus sp. Mel]